MKNSQAAAQYRIAQFESASPVKIVQMLNAGAIRFLKLAMTFETTDKSYRENIRRAEDIIAELRVSLNHDPNPELSANLESLYIFMQGELSRAIIEKDTAGIDATIELLTTLLDGWKLASAAADGTENGQAPTSISHVS